MEALALAAALFTADAKVRDSGEFALLGELRCFPDAELVKRDQKLANEHLEFLQRCKVQYGDINPQIDGLIERQQWVTHAYTNLVWARLYIGHTFYEDNPGDPIDDDFNVIMSAHQKNFEYAKDHRDKLVGIIGYEAYYAGRLPPPLPCMIPVEPLAAEERNDRPDRSSPNL